MKLDNFINNVKDSSYPLGDLKFRLWWSADFPPEQQIILLGESNLHTYWCGEKQDENPKKVLVVDFETLKRYQGVEICWCAASSLCVEGKENTRGDFLPSLIEVVNAFNFNTTLTQNLQEPCSGDLMESLLKRRQALKDVLVSIEEYEVLLSWKKPLEEDIKRIESFFYQNLRFNQQEASLFDSHLMLVGMRTGKDVFEGKTPLFKVSKNFYHIPQLYVEEMIEDEMIEPHNATKADVPSSETLEIMDRLFDEQYLDGNTRSILASAEQLVK